MTEKSAMLSSRERAYLRGLASGEDTIIHIGKSGITENLRLAADNALRARELIKGRVLENSPISPREAAEELSRLCSAETVQVIGAKFVLYRANPEEPKISLRGRR